MRLSRTANQAARAIVKHVESLPNNPELPLTSCLKIIMVVQAAINEARKKSRKREKRTT